MAKGAVDYVGDGLKAAMRMPGRALRLSWPVVHRAHLVHVHERVEFVHVDAGKGASNRKAVSLDASRRGGQRVQRTFDRGSGGRAGDAREHKKIGNRDCWHRASIQSTTAGGGPK